MERIILKKELITPEMANQILEKNHINRRLRIDDVNAYARDILNGNWKENSDPITISKSGNLLNGQHRLNAIIKAGVAAEMYVRRDAPDDCIFDIGIPRSAGDTIAIENKVDREFSKNEYVSLARFMVGEELSKRKGGKKITHQEIENYIMENVCYLEKLKYITTGNKKAYFTTVPVRVAVYTALKAGMDKDLLRNFWKVMVYGFQNSEEENPIIAYRNYIINLTQRGRQTWDETIKRGQYAIREYANKTKRKRSVNPGDFIYPLI